MNAHMYFAKMAVHPITNSFSGFGNPKTYPPSFKTAVERAKQYKADPRLEACHKEVQVSAIGMYQHKYILRELAKATGFDRPVIEYLGSTKLNKDKYNQLKKLSPSWNWLISLFYDLTTVSSPYPYYHRMGCVMSATRTFFVLGSQLLYDAYGLGNQTLDVKYRSADVLAFLKGMRATMDTTAMPIFADCLQDTGFGETKQQMAVLENYRNPEARFSLGSWVFRAAGVL